MVPQSLWLWLFWVVITVGIASTVCVFPLFCSWIYSSLPASKQMLAVSATYPEFLANALTKYMREPTFVRLNSSDPSLIGWYENWILSGFVCDILEISFT